ncbi:uncharacterized protein LOC125178467 [Hyalella azteca]|uniref:Uncharacterized protein LOC125178467 n=1 Tax=Hyalella azteca TaxID=294128 RepID=A0A979FPS2_HYAAZ|nr:uncharacterized protein LOC125178467 [Hyalella azteca]
MCIRDSTTNDIVKLKSPPPKPARAPVPAPVPTPPAAAPQQEGQVSLVDVFVSSFAGEHNLLLQAQYEQVNPEPPAILPHAFLQPRSLPATPTAGGRQDALVKKVGELAAPQEGEQAPPQQEKPLPPLCTGTQRLLLQVLADAYHLQHQELSRLTHAAAARQGAVEPPPAEADKEGGRETASQLQQQRRELCRSLEHLVLRLHHLKVCS